MENWFEFALDRYNYWIVIVLMMTGLYIVFARGNLVKKVVGLNLFQTSVFVFYITIGKISGGTAPIYRDGELERAGGHEGDHSDEAGGDHAASDHGTDNTHGADSAHEAGEAVAAKTANTVEGLHSKIENTIGTDNLKFAPNDLTSAANTQAGDAGNNPAVEGLHAAPSSDISAKISNDVLNTADKTLPEAGFDIAEPHGSEAVTDGAHGIADAHSALGEVIYTNPLPHVLILTAIVVGVATTAVGLALAIRIREAYGTIEEDELEAIDNIAEFGETEGGLRGDLAGGRA